MDLALYKVLIIEDDYLIAEDLRRACEEAHCLVLGPARSEADALAIVDNEIPDIAIVDLNLGEGITSRVPDVLRQHNIPFCIATAYDRASVPHGLEDVPYLQKPVEREALLKMLDDVQN